MRKYIREPFPALSHLIGAGVSVVAVFFLLQRASGSVKTEISVAIYGMSLIVLYVASALNHGFHCSPPAAERLEQCDYAAIFLLIAGTYTPVCLLVVQGRLGWFLFGFEWLLALIGIFLVFARPSTSAPLRVVIYLAMGWLFLFVLAPIVTAVTTPLLMWLLSGALFYSIGSVFFVTKKPVLWRGYFEAHDLWHVFVLAGSGCHFIFIREYILRVVV